MLQPHQLNFNKAFLIILVAISFAFVRAQLAPQANSAGPSPATGANAGSTPVFKNRAELVLVPVVVRPIPQLDVIPTREKSRLSLFLDSEIEFLN